MRGGWDGRGRATREAGRGSRERMNGLAATRRARCGWNYDRISRTVHPDRIRTYVLEVRYEKKERPECFHFRSGLIKRCAYTRYDRPIVTTPRTIEARYPPRSVALSPFPVPTHSINQKVTKISLRALSFTKLLKKTFLLLMSLK